MDVDEVIEKLQEIKKRGLEHIPVIVHVYDRGEKIESIKLVSDFSEVHLHVSFDL